MKIAVYGATGYTGGLVVTELTRRNIDVVLVGRNIDRLLDAAAGIPNATLRPVGLDEPDTLAAAFRDCDVVINCVAPFVLYGEPVVRAAIAAGVHYVDISGEQSYIKGIFDTFAEQAELAGVTVVPMVNDGGFLADLLVSLVAIDTADDVVVAHRFAGAAGISRGSAGTALANLELFTSGGLTFEDREWKAGTPTRHSSITFPGDTEPSFVVRFAMPEIATIPRHIRARHVEGVADKELLALFTAVTPELVAKIPAGPTDDLRRAARFTLVAEVDGRRGVVEGSDTYGTTAITAVEAAYRLATVGAKAGVLAPAQAFDPAHFLDCLTPHGVRYQTR